MIHNPPPGALVVPKQEILNLIFELFPWSQRFRAAPVHLYAAALFNKRRQESRCDERQHAQSMMQAWIGQVARRRGFDATEVAAFEEEIISFPVLQTGPHLHLLIEPDAFYTHLFSLMGLMARDSRSYISYGCSTVKFAERGRKGPGWLKLGGDAVNVFGLTRSQMIPNSILARNGLYRFSLRNADRTGPETQIIARLRSDLPSTGFASAADAIKDANMALWRRYFSDRISMLQIDDEDVADLVVEHLLDRHSWVRARLVDGPNVATALLEAIDSLADTAWRGWLRNSTHFFWGSNHGRLFPLTLQGGFLHGGARDDVKIPFIAESLIEQLRRRDIIPNLLTMFIVTSILPGTRVLGGSRHTIYYPLMRYAFYSGLEKNGADRALASDFLQDDLTCAWGHRVISGHDEPFLALQDGSLASVRMLLDSLDEVGLEAASGSLSGFTHDPLWADLVGAFRSGMASRACPQWTFS